VQINAVETDLQRLPRPASYITSGIESHGPPIIVPLTFGWARTSMGEASGRNLIAALIRDRATAMAVGWQIEINHVESESTSSRAYEIMSKLGCADFIAIIEQLVGQTTNRGSLEV